MLARVNEAPENLGIWRTFSPKLEQLAGIDR
jgi:hypothetical protein